MTKSIWKFPLSGPLLTHVRMPEGAIILSAQHQESADGLMLWAEVDIDAPMVSRAFYVAPTGGPLPDGREDWKFIGTAQWGRTVWHVFEVNKLGTL